MHQQQLNVKLPHNLSPFEFLQNRNLKDFIHAQKIPYQIIYLKEWYNQLNSNFAKTSFYLSKF